MDGGSGADGVAGEHNQSEGIVVLNLRKRNEGKGSLSQVW